MYLLCTCSYDTTRSLDGTSICTPDNVCSSIPLYPAPTKVRNGGFCKLSRSPDKTGTNCTYSPTSESCLFGL